MKNEMNHISLDTKICKKLADELNVRLANYQSIKFFI